MAAHNWKEKQLISNCVDSARRKMRTARKMEKKGSHSAAEMARQMAFGDMYLARFTKQNLPPY